MNKLRWGKFYWSDWANDTALNLCSMPAQGLWMGLLCIAAQGEPYGYVTIGGNPPSDSMLKRLIRQPDMRLRDLRRLLAELERNGVIRRTEAGIIYSLRMVRDFARAEHASKAARARHNNGGSQESYNKNRHGATTRQPPDNHARTTEIAKNGGNGRPIVAGANTEAEADASSLFKREEEASAPDAHGDGVVRFNGARRHHALPETQPRGSDDYLRNLLQAYQTP